MSLKKIHLGSIILVITISAYIWYDRVQYIWAVAGDESFAAHPDTNHLAMISTYIDMFVNIFLVAGLVGLLNLFLYLRYKEN